MHNSVFLHGINIAFHKKNYTQKYIVFIFMSRAHLKEEEKDLHQHQWPLENLLGTRNDHLAFCTETFICLNMNDIYTNAVQYNKMYKQATYKLILYFW